VNENSHVEKSIVWQARENQDITAPPRIGTSSSSLES
jgi:hypothetical protein